MSVTAFELRRRRAQNNQQSAQEKPIQNNEQPAQKPSVFDMSGHWLSVRARIRDAVGAETMPTNKDEGREWLQNAGYEVEE